MRELAIALCIPILLTGCGSPNKKSSLVCEEVYASTRESPVIIGGLSTLQKDMQYPKEALENAIEGVVEVGFVVNKRGRVQEARIIKGLGYGIDQEALRLINTAKFEPAVEYLTENPVCTRFALSINFLLPED